MLHTLSCFLHFHLYRYRFHASSVKINEIMFFTSAKIATNPFDERRANVEASCDSIRLEGYTKNSIFTELPGQLAYLTSFLADSAT